MSTVFGGMGCVIFSFVKISMRTFYYSPAMVYWHVCKSKINGYVTNLAAFPKCDRFRESYSHHTVALWHWNMRLKRHFQFILKTVATHSGGMGHWFLPMSDTCCFLFARDAFL